jgi:hypothetical protein
MKTIAALSLESGYEAMPACSAMYDPIVAV